MKRKPGHNGHHTTLQGGFTPHITIWLGYFGWPDKYSEIDVQYFNEHIHTTADYMENTNKIKTQFRPQQVFPVINYGKLHNFKEPSQNGPMFCRSDHVDNGALIHEEHKSVDVMWDESISLFPVSYHAFLST
jgi:hypothetical protein